MDTNVRNRKVEVYYPETYDEALNLLCNAMKELNCKNRKEYISRNKFYPSLGFFSSKFSIKMSDVIKVINPSKAKYELIFPTKQSLVKLVGKYLKETDDTLSIVNFDSWFERDISKYILKVFNMTWNQFKLYMLSIYPKYEDRIVRNSRGGLIL